MKDRGRFVILALLMALLAAAAVWLALRFGWFDQDTAPVILPETTAALPRGDEGAVGGLLTAEVTPETVQAVVGTLVRPDSYSRTLSVESFWQGGSQSWTVTVWQKTGATRIRQQAADARQVKNVLVSEDTVTIWYRDDGKDAAVYALSDPAMTDTLQLLPTYEDVLLLDLSQIEEAGYVLQADAWRIMVSARESATGFRMVYFISIETGLLEAAERWDGDRLLYRMTADTADLAAPADNLFLVGS